jgi:hypothetical protein
MALRSVRSAYDLGSLARLVGYRMGDQYLELFRASEGTLSYWSRLHLQLLAPTNLH